MFAEGDIVRIVDNGYDNPDDPASFLFQGAEAVVEEVRYLNGQHIDYNIRLLDQHLHRALSGGGTGDNRWPFYEDELELVRGA